MAIVANMAELYRAVRLRRLVLRLLWHHDLLNDMSSEISDYMDSARVVVESILDLTHLINLDCVPGNEWAMLHALRKRCNLIEAILLVASTERDTVLDECIEATDHYCYLLKFENPRLATIIERRCCLGDDPCSTTAISSSS